MRKHRRFLQLAPAIDAERFHALVRPEYLVAARLDTGFSVRIDNYGCLDLTFARDGEVAIVPFVIVQGMQLFLREDSPFVWPEWLPPMRRDLGRAIEAQIEPWLRSYSIAKYVGGELVTTFGTDAHAHAIFERAREYGFLGAASTERAIVDLAPYVFALRFARGSRVAIADRAGAGGAALLSRIARVDALLGDPELSAAARQWFALDVFKDTLGTERYDIAIGDASADAAVRIGLGPEARGRVVPVARPIPLSLMVSNDPADGVEVRRFWVTAPALAFRDIERPAMTIVGGSTGRIGLVVRDDYLSTGDADIDAARITEARLREQGFMPSIVNASRVRAKDFDLLHVFGFRCAAFLRHALGGATLPTVIEPYADDPKNESLWGMAVHRESLSNAAEESMRDLYNTAIADRLLVAPSAPPIGTGLSTDEDVGALMASAGAAVVSCEDEERRLREDFGFGGTVRVVPALAGDYPLPSPAAGELAGLREFVFVHAPIDPRCNQYHLARICAARNMPLVVVGPVGNTEYYGEVLAALGDDGVLLPEDALSPEDLSALYARCRVFADVSWSGYGLARLARAALSGAALVVSSAGYGRLVWPGLAEIGDPASPESIGLALKTAWDRAGRAGPETAKRTSEICRPFESLVAVLGAYQAAAGLTVS